MATLKDVAREAGLTVTTVSRVLNNRGYISDNARERVAMAMKKLNSAPALRLTPTEMAPRMVEPDREVPGTRLRH